ncbi:MAG: hypothetical protein NTY08_18770 [Proteobacteria bacterium]|nr:hypothetical protein [Pseudomonadota bacterium]
MVTTGSKIERIFAVCCCMAAVAMITGCRSKMDVKTVGTPLSSRNKLAKPVEQPNAVLLKGVKKFFQTRETITIEIEPSVIDGAPSFSLLNTTKSGDDDSKAMLVLQENTPTLSLVDRGSHSLRLDGDGKVTVSFHPMGAAWKNKFYYGLNTIKVIANDLANPRFSTVQFTLQDFDIMDFSVMSFADKNEMQTLPDNGGYFEGWLNVVGPAQAVYKDGSSALTAGMHNIVNGF